MAITLVPGAAEVQEVCGSLAGALAPGAVWVEMSSAAPHSARRTASAVASAAAGARVLDAPVGGSPQDAPPGPVDLFRRRRRV
jgi:3-hydroxyisobutyrate dehydrogenase